MADTPSRQSWWQTLPGILTGVAALITAVTGLMVAFNHSASRSQPAASSSFSDPRDVRSTSVADSRTSGGSNGSPGTRTVPRLSVSQVKLGGGTAVVTILSAQTDTIDADRRSLTFRVRYMNAGRFPANFWASSFRLLVDNVPRAPTNNLNEVVDSDSAKEGDVVFELPVATREVVLQISAGDDTTRVPVTLR